MDWAQTWTVIGAVSGVIALQSFWINRALERIEIRFEAIDRRFEAIDRRFDRIDQRLDSIEQSVVRDHGERIARLEQRGP